MQLRLTLIELRQVTVLESGSAMRLVHRDSKGVAQPLKGGEERRSEKSMEQGWSE